MLTRRTDVDFAVGESEHDAAAYTVDGDQLTYTAGGLSESYRVVQDPDGHAPPDRQPWR